MSGDFGFGFTAGFIIAALLVTAVAIGLQSRGRDECEQPLKRAESCVQKWVPLVEEKP